MFPMGTLYKDSPFSAMEYFNFEELTQDVKQINDNQKYWLIRTSGGSYYEEFVNSGYIAVGYNAITLADIESLPKNEKQAKKVLKILFNNRYPDKERNGHQVSQILKFSRDIQVGDIVMAPSENSARIAIGVVKSSLFEAANTAEGSCKFVKRRKVKWITAKNRWELHPTLQLVFVSRHILSNVTNYAPYIDSLMYSFYVKDEETHLVLKIRTDKDVSLDDFCSINAIPALIEDFCLKNDISFCKEDLIMKIQMESPGWLRLTGKNILGLLFFGLFINAICGGGVQYNQEGGKTEFSVTTNGIGGAINNYLDREADRKLIESAVRAVDSMKITKPEDIDAVIKLLEKRNEIRDKY